jgi:hypothetical protein
MKSLFYTLLILGGIFLAYDYYLARPWERVVFEKGPRPATTPQPALPTHTIEDDGPQAAPASSSSNPAKDTAKKDEWQPTIPKIPTNEFTPPPLPSAEQVTKNWTYIPPQAFPRSVILKKDVEVKMSVGGSTLRAGATAQALSADNGSLTIAPTATSPARGVIAVTDTDFPDQIQVSYAKWKESRIAQARQAWINAKTGITTPAKDNSTLSNGQGVSFGADGKPVQNADGSYNLLLAVISSGRITDVDPQKVKHWSLPRSETLDGKPTWVVDVTYATNTLFGPMDVSSHAYIRDKQLLKWTYDSGEPVP